MPLTLTAYPSGRFYPWHAHELPTLFVQLAGQHHEETRGRSFDQPPLSVIFHPTTGPHTTAVGPDGLVGLNVGLTDAWLDRCHLRRRDLVAEYRLLDSRWARLLGLRLAASAGEAGDAAGAEAETAALELLAELVSSAAPPARAPRWLGRAEEFLRAYFRTPVRLRDVAAEVGVHPAYCARAFRRATGCTVSAYVRALRLLDAGRLVLDEGRCLADVALRAGFADQAHFTRACSRTLGFTPGRLRRLRRELLAEPAG
jgi:AraC family transcriptional regulator